MKIAQVTPLYEAVPPKLYGGTERVVAHLTDALHHAERVRGQVSTVGLGALGDNAPELVMQLARWGVTRVCPLGQMQNPPLTWRHDGRPALGDLVTWTDWETGC